ncbi:MAG TPA: hypothetical protein VK274_01355 [Pyrinomonadaceae bacterium]|nr:hypothetical protein [Pyrinomonadaceae bacterium]
MEKRPRINADSRGSAFMRGRFPIFLLIVLSAHTVTAQTNLHSRVKISVSNASQIKVDAELSTPISSWSFRNAYAGVLGIAERIQDFRAVDADVRKAAAGEYRSDRKSSKISYTVKLPKPTLAGVSHLTWLVEDRGVLMLADLIPIEVDSLSAEFVLPEGWTGESSISRDAGGRYDVAEPEKAVFLLGSTLRKSSTTVDGMPLDIVLSGKWRFKERDASERATRVMQKYLELTGFRLPGKSVIMIAPLPIKDGKTEWKAETRGSTVVLLINPDAGFKLWKAQLTIIFTHEVLHLWVPNSLKLEGDYDWFFEGFTLYTALRTALELRVIDFKEYLATLGRVYDVYRAHPDTLSLIDESERRWASTGSQVYVKGMLVAFLYDLMVRKESGGQRTLAYSYRDLFSGRLTDGADANDVIISVLGSTPDSRSFIKAYVENSMPVELNKVLPAYGLSVLFTGKGSQLRVSDVNEDQKQLLRSLGYRD